LLLLLLQERKCWRNLLGRICISIGDGTEGTACPQAERVQGLQRAGVVMVQLLQMLVLGVVSWGQHLLCAIYKRGVPAANVVSLRHMYTVRPCRAQPALAEVVLHHCWLAAGLLQALLGDSHPTKQQLRTSLRTSLSNNCICVRS
jgi:hypothetical protein